MDSFHVVSGWFYKPLKTQTQFAANIISRTFTWEYNINNFIIVNISKLILSRIWFEISKLIIIV